MESGRNADTKPYLPLYVDDWFSSVRASVMNLAQRGAYLELLMRQWRDGQIPNASVVERLYPELNKAEVLEILEAFPSNRNERLERERELVTKRIAGRRLGAQRTNAQRPLTARSAHAQRPLSDRSATADRTLSARSATANRTHAEAEAEAEAEAVLAPSEPSVADAPERTRKHRMAPTGPNTELIRWWETEWTRTRCTTWEWLKADAVAMARCLKLAKNDLLEAKQRVTRILESQDRWVADNASPRTLVSHWNSHGFKIIHKQKTALQETLDGLDDSLLQRKQLP